MPQIRVGLVWVFAFFGYKTVYQMSLPGLRSTVYYVILGLCLDGQTALSDSTEISDCIFNTSSTYMVYRVFILSEYCLQNETLDLLIHGINSFSISVDKYSKA